MAERIYSFLNRRKNDPCMRSFERLITFAGPWPDLFLDTELFLYKDTSNGANLNTIQGLVTVNKKILTERKKKPTKNKKKKKTKTNKKEIKDKSSIFTISSTSGNNLVL